MNEPQAALIWCPFPDHETARETAKTLLREDLIACANIIGGVEAVFNWNEEQSSAIEVAVMFKTVSHKKSDTILRIGECHPYDTPAIVAWDCDAAHPATLEWLGHQLNGR